MKKNAFAILVSFILLSCTNSSNKSSVEGTGADSQLLQKITNEEFKSFVGTFETGKFPWDVSETPLLTEGEAPANFHQMSMEGLKKFISPDATESKGYYTGYAFFENEYIALIYFYSYSSPFGGDNYNTSTNLLTFGFDGKQIGNILIGEANSRVNSDAQRESQKIEGSIYADKRTSIKTNNFLEENPNGSSSSISFLIKPNGEIEQTETPVNNPDQIAAEFEKAKIVADSLKQTFEIEKHGLLKVSYTEISEGTTSWICYFNQSFKLNHIMDEKKYDENVMTTTYEFYNQEGPVLWYQIDQQGNKSNIIIRLNHHIYEKEFDTEKSAYNYSIKEDEVGEPFAFKDQLVKYKLITTQENPQGNIAEKKMNEIPKEEFTYDSDSSCYRITIQKGEKGEFGSFWSELRIDNTLFIHLFGDK